MRERKIIEDELDQASCLATGSAERELFFEILLDIRELIEKKAKQ